MMDWVVALLAGIVIGAVILFLFLKITSQKAILNAHKNAENILTDAQKEAETLKKSALIEAEDEIFEQKQQLEQDHEKKRFGLSEFEAKLDEREIEIDRKAALTEKKEKDILGYEQELRNKESYVSRKTEELNRLITEQIEKLEILSGLSRDEAKQLLLKDLEEDAREEGLRIIQHTVEKARLEANRKARDIVVRAIQQIAGEQSVEATISIITLPNDDMKGRIIGREGRNIRAFEMITGVDVIIDDTPEIVVLSSYNSFRREIAKATLEKLVSDGRIHPARIEEIFEKTAEEMQESLAEIGEQALLDASIHGVDPEVTALLGKLKYHTAFGQNVLDHSIEVANICGIMASELGLDVRMAKRAGMLHDIGKAVENYTDADHASLGAEFLKKHNEPEMVVNAVEAHHNERLATTAIALLVASANNISGNRPGARRESLEIFIKRMEQLEEIAATFDGVVRSYAIQAGREIRVIVDTTKVDDGNARSFARDIARRIQDELEFPGQIKVTVIREYRAFDYAT